jgi:glycerophosphoryl diester phosphodiesterase
MAVGKVAVHGHRGARGRRPENTLAAFAYAIDAGADAIEMDIVLTRDGVPVVMHEERPELTLSELHARMPDVPALSAVLALAPRGEFLFNIEIKPFPDAQRIAELVVTLVAPLQARAMYQSFDFAILRELRHCAPAVPQAALFERTKEDFVSIARRAQTGMVSAEFHLVTPEKVEAAHRAGIRLLAWTANRAAQWRTLMDAGVDAIITDYPAELVAYRDRV